jgi:hypothetical protein
MSKLPDLWPEDIAEPGDLKPPVVILREQATYLGAKTQNIVEGDVDTSALLQGEGFRHTFYVVAPALGGYRFHLFEVTHGMGLYLITIRWQDKPHQAESEEEFLNVLRDIFTSEETKRVIRSLIIQSKK